MEVLRLPLTGGFIAHSHNEGLLLVREGF